MKTAFKLLIIMFFLSSISLAEEPQVYTDQDLKKYKSPGDDINRQINLREKKLHELNIKIDRSQRNVLGTSNSGLKRIRNLRNGNLRRYRDTVNANYKSYKKRLPCDTYMHRRF